MTNWHFITIGIMLAFTLNVAYSQVEEQEGNAQGKMDKLMEVLDKCSRTIELDPDSFDIMKDDRFKVLDAINSDVTKLLKDNKNSIENILYGG